MWKLQQAYDPARIIIQVALLPSEYIPFYVDEKVVAFSTRLEAAATLKTEGGGIGMLRMEQASTDIVFEQVFSVTNGRGFLIGYPDTLGTNGLDIFRSTNLLERTWELIATNLPTDGTNELTWTTTDVSSFSFFYRACNASADSDSDGIPDAIEMLVLGTCETNVDSDGDGLVDGFSGVVSTNSYTDGVHTNGGAFVDQLFDDVTAMTQTAPVWRPE